MYAKCDAGVDVDADANGEDNAAPTQKTTLRLCVYVCVYTKYFACVVYECFSRAGFSFLQISLHSKRN